MIFNNLLKASITIKMILSNGASVSAFLSPSLNSAMPGRIGLYGKKPIANTMTAMGRSIFANISNKTGAEIRITLRFVQA